MFVEEYASHSLVSKVTAGLMTDDNNPKSAMVMLIQRVDSHHVCMWVCMYVCTVCMYVCTLHICMYVCNIMYVCMYVQYVCMYGMYVCMHA